MTGSSRGVSSEVGKDFGDVRSGTPDTDPPSSDGTNSNANSGPNSRSNSPVDLNSQLVNPAPIDKVMGNPRVGLSSNGAVELVDNGADPGRLTYIHANLIETCRATQSGHESSKKRCLGQTPSKLNLAALGPQVNDRDLHHITTLLDKAHEFKGDSSEKSAHITQFLSPLAFNNPLQSIDRAMSDLIAHFADGRNVVGDYRIISLKKSEHLGTKFKSESGLTRKFEIEYSKDGGSAQTVILTEHAPEYRNGQMSTEAITKALKAIGDADPDVMLSYLGVGRVAIMQVVLDVQARVKRFGPVLSSRDPTIEQMLKEAIEKVEAARGSYISRKPAQKDAILEVLRNYAPEWDKAIAAAEAAAQIKAPVPKPAEAVLGGSDDWVGTESPGTGTSRSNTPEPTVPAPAALAPAADPASVDTNADAAPVAVPLGAEVPPQSGKIDPIAHVPLANVGLSSGLNKCYAHSAFKFMHCWLGQHFTVHSEFLNKEDGKDKPLIELREELQKVVERLSGQTTDTAVGTLRDFIDKLTTNDLKKLALTNELKPGATPLPTSTSVLTRFSEHHQEDVTEFVTAVTSTLGINKLEENFNSPFLNTQWTWTPAGANANQQKEGATAFSATFYSKVLKAGPPLHQIMPITDVASENGVIDEFQRWVKSSFRKNVGYMENYNLKSSMYKDDGDEPDERFTPELCEKIKSEAEGAGLELKTTTVRNVTSLCVADATAPSKFAMSLQTYLTEPVPEAKPGQPTLPPDQRVFDLQAIDLNKEIKLDVIDQKDNIEKTITYMPTAFVFHSGMSEKAGHYFMLAKEPPENEGKWMRHDDNVVSEVTENIEKFTSNGTRARPTMVLLEAVKWEIKVPEDITREAVQTAPPPAAPPKANATSTQVERRRTRETSSNSSTTRINTASTAAHIPATRQPPTLRALTLKAFLKWPFNRKS